MILMRSIYHKSDTWSLVRLVQFGIMNFARLFWWIKL